MRKSDPLCFGNTVVIVYHDPTAMAEFSEWLRHIPILIFTQCLLYPLYSEQVLKTKYMLYLIIIY